MESQMTPAWEVACGGIYMLLEPVFPSPHLLLALG